MSAEASRVVNVYILAGQSNMVGMGRVALDLNANGGQGSLGYMVKNPDTAKKYANFVDVDGTWKTRNDVVVYFKRDTQGIKNGGLTVGFGANNKSFGPELEFGAVVGDATQEPVLLIKEAWVGKILCVEFRPPISGGKPVSSTLPLPTKPKTFCRISRRCFPSGRNSPSKSSVFAGSKVGMIAATMVLRRKSTRRTWLISSKTSAKTWGSPICHLS